MSESELNSSPLPPAEPLSRAHNLSSFDCGRHPSLNIWLQRFAWQNQQNETSRTYVVHRAGSVVAYYSIAAGSVSREEAPARVLKGLARHPAPVIVLTRLAVDKCEQGMGLGKAMLKDALMRIAAAAEIVGARAVIVHAIDSEAAAFYRKFGFEPSPTSNLNLMLLMKDLRASMAR